MKKIIICGMLIGILMLCIVIFFSARDNPHGSDSQVNTSIHETRGSSNVNNNEGSGTFLNWFKNLFRTVDDSDNDDNVSPEYLELVDKIRKLYDDFNLLPSEKQDEKKFLLDQFSLVIDYELGPNHPKKKEMLEIIGWSYDERQPLNKKFLNGELTRKEFFKKLDDHLRELGKKYASILTDEEYRAMFNMNKGENLAASIGLTPEIAEALDKQEKQIPSYGLRKEDFTHPEGGGMTEEQMRNIRSAYEDPPGFFPQPKVEKKGGGR